MCAVPTIVRVKGVRRVPRPQAAARNVPLDQSPGRRLADVHDSWEGYFGHLLSEDDARQRLGGLSGVEIDDLVTTHQLLALPMKHGELAFPEFQFAGQAGLNPVVAAILAILEPVVESPYTMAAWFISPQPMLNGETPARWLERARSTERLTAAARDSAARLGQ